MSNNYFAISRPDVMWHQPDNLPWPQIEIVATIPHIEDDCNFVRSYLSGRAVVDDFGRVVLVEVLS